MDNFRLNAGHNILAEQLNRITKLADSLCIVYNVDIMHKQHLYVCPNLDSTLQNKGDICQLY